MTAVNAANKDDRVSSIRANASTTLRHQHCQKIHLEDDDMACSFETEGSLLLDDDDIMHEALFSSNWDQGQLILDTAVCASPTGVGEEIISNVVSPCSNKRKSVQRQTVPTFMNFFDSPTGDSNPKMEHHHHHLQPQQQGLYNNDEGSSLMNPALTAYNFLDNDEYPDIAPDVCVSTEMFQDEEEDKHLAFFRLASLTQNHEPNHYLNLAPHKDFLGEFETITTRNKNVPLNVRQQFQKQKVSASVPDPIVSTPLEKHNSRGRTRAVKSPCKKTKASNRKQHDKKKKRCRKRRKTPAKSKACSKNHKANPKPKAPARVNDVVFVDFYAVWKRLETRMKASEKSREGVVLEPIDKDDKKKQKDDDEQPPHASFVEAAKQSAASRKDLLQSWYPEKATAKTANHDSLLQSFTTTSTQEEKKGNLSRRMSNPQF